MTTVAEMVALRRRIVAEARTWVGTDFHHQGRVKRTGPAKKQRGGVDCLGLVWGVGEAVGAMPVVTAEAAKRYWRFYGRRPNPPEMIKCLQQFLVPVPDDEHPSQGDIAWMHWGNQIPIHMALLGEFEGRETLIHSIWQMGVMEHTLSPDYRERIASFWRYPALAEVAP